MSNATSHKEQQAALQKIAAKSKAALKAAAAKGSAKKIAPKKSGKPIVTGDDDASTNRISVPPHRHEIHVKKQLITYWVTLHKVPPKFVDISATTDQTLNVQVNKGYNAKFSLVEPFPHGMIVDSATAEYKFDSGVLECIFPVKKMPKACEDEWNARLDSIRQSQRTRFKSSIDGDARLRSRQLKITAVKEDSKNVSGKKVAAAKPTAGEKPAAPAKPAGSTDAPKASKQPASDADVKRIAEAAGRAAQESIRSRIEKARAQHKARLQKMTVRVTRKDDKTEGQQQAMMRVMNEQAAKLEQQGAKLDLGVSPAKSKAASQASPSGKKVSFK